MKKGLVIADSGPVFSLAIIGKLDILNQLFEEVFISQAVWEEISFDRTTKFFPSIAEFFKERVRSIQTFNELTLIMDYGESEDRKIAENFNINCIGTLGILSIARTKGWIVELRSVFQSLLQNNRYYAIRLLNMLLEQHGEDEL